MLSHPEVAFRSCDDCARYVYDEDGSIRRRPARVGLPVERDPRIPTPCDACPKIPASAPERTRAHAVEVTAQLLAAWQHYLECRAVGQFPDDPLVRRHAAIFAAAVDEQQQLPLLRLMAKLDAVLGLAALARR